MLILISSMAELIFLTDYIPHKGVHCQKKYTYQLTDYQLSELKKRFQSDPYIKSEEKKLLAKNLGITPYTVAFWFSLQRMMPNRNLADEARNVTVATAWQAELKTNCICNYMYFVKQYIYSVYILRLFYSMVIILRNILTMHTSTNVYDIVKITI